MSRPILPRFLRRACLALALAAVPSATRGAVPPSAAITADIVVFGGTPVSAATATRTREFHSPYQLVNVFGSYAWRQGRFRHSVALNGNNVFDKFYLNPSNRLGRGRETSTTYTLGF